MAGSALERQIFDAASRPDDDEIDPSGVDAAVSEAIQNIDRRHEPPPAPYPRQPSDRRPGAGQPDPLDGVEDRSQSGLLRALLDERDKRQEIAGQLSRYQREEQDRQAKQQQPALSEALFTDPEGTLNRLREEWMQPVIQQIAQIRLDGDFKASHARHGEAFERAWGEWYEAVKDGQDATSYFSVMNAASPGEAMVAWYRQREAMAALGEGGIDGYRRRVIEEYLASQGMAADRPRGPNGQFVARPQAPQRLPTATSRLGGSGDPGGDDDELNDGSDAAIFAAARPSRRRR